MTIKRWPIVRHIRWCYYRIAVNRHYAFWMDNGYFPTNAAIDERWLTKIWMGEA